MSSIEKAVRLLCIEVNPEASALRSACTLALAERAAVATPPLVDAILEVRS